MLWVAEAGPRNAPRPGCRALRRGGRYLPSHVRDQCRPGEIFLPTYLSYFGISCFSLSFFSLVEMTYCHTLLQECPGCCIERILHFFANRDAFVSTTGRHQSSKSGKGEHSPGGPISCRHSSAGGRGRHWRGTICPGRRNRAPDRSRHVGSRQRR